MHQSTPKFFVSDCCQSSNPDILLEQTSLFGIQIILHLVDQLFDCERLRSWIY